MLKYQMIYEYSKISYYRYGICHRKNVPAYIMNNALCIWFEYGQLHHKDGPAVIYTSGNTEYWNRGNKC